MKRGEVLLDTGQDSGPFVRMRVTALREQLAAQGLHVVTDTDKAVLDAMARIPEAILRDAAGMYGHLAPSMDDLKAPVRAELARRGLT